MTLLYFSAQNIDRLVSFYCTSLKAGKIFAIDFYTANILGCLKDYASIPYPFKYYANIRVLFPYWLDGLTIFPLEVKAGENLQARSLRVFREKYDAKFAIHTSLSNLRKNEGLLNIPLSAFFNLKRYIDKVQ